MAIYRVPVDLTFPGGGSPGVNVFHLESVDAGAAEALIVGALAALEDAYQALPALLAQGTQAQFRGVISEVTTGEELSGTPWTVTSTANTGSAAPVLAQVISWRTGTTQRSGVGRTFLGPLAPGAVDAQGTPSAAMLTAVGIFVNSVLDYNDAEATAPGNGFVVYSRTTGLGRVITSARRRDQFAVLRSRRD